MLVEPSVVTEELTVTVPVREPVVGMRTGDTEDDGWLSTAAGQRPEPG